MSTRNPDNVTRFLAKLYDLEDRLNPDGLGAFADEVLTWNTRLGLVSKRETVDVLARLVRVSVSLWDFVAEAPAMASHPAVRRVADVGSGAGFPGIIWKLLSPQIVLTMIERKDRRAFFLERVIVRLGLDGANVISGDFREFARRPEAHESFDLVTLMAVARPRDLEDALEPVLRAGGWLVVRRPLAEPRDPQVGKTLHLVHQQTSPKAHLLLYQKRPGGDG